MQQHFTSVIFKIEIQNLPRHFEFAQLKKMLTGLQLEPKKVKAVNKATYAFVTFRLNNTVTPLWNQPYEDQLSTKQTNTRKFLRNLSKMLQRNIGEMSPWLKQQR
ncbi:tRNA (uracil-5-)-methyltransferase homolog A-like isoform X1 [Patiria miniata]|uniref:Uncharacterized protein n=1 Tax=Patiria miniata TaxID=46514 RepID=A0A914A627_PATMI|nr:tRNA (uracil-5-)-methyltransferase homolog A-like isoform X1 [Patiria miniata]